MRRQVRRAALVAVSLVVAVTALAGLWFYLAFIRGDHQTDRPGGHWAIDSVRYAADSRAGGELFYESPSKKRTRVAQFVHVYRYYGDDCLAFDSAERGAFEYFFACGPRKPLLLNGDRSSTWDFEPDAPRPRLSSAHIGPASTTTPALADLKTEARKQPALDQ